MQIDKCEFLERNTKDWIICSHFTFIHQNDWCNSFKQRCLNVRQTNLCYFVLCLAGIRTSPAAHSVRALHPVSLPILCQRLLNDGRTLCFQHSLPAHEREGEVRLIQRKHQGRFNNIIKFLLWCEASKLKVLNLHMRTWTAVCCFKNKTESLQLLGHSTNNCLEAKKGYCL